MTYYKNEKGAIFLTVGTGGKDLYNFTGQKPFVIEQFGRHGFVNVEVMMIRARLTRIRRVSASSIGIARRKSSRVELADA